MQPRLLVLLMNRFSQHGLLLVIFLCPQVVPIQLIAFDIAGVTTANDGCNESENQEPENRSESEERIDSDADLWAIRRQRSLQPTRSRLPVGCLKSGLNQWNRLHLSSANHHDNDSSFLRPIRC